MPLLKHVFDTHSTEPAQKFDPTSCAQSLSSPTMPPHLHKVAFVPVSDCMDGNLPAALLQPSSTITHSEKSHCLATTRNLSKLPKPRRAFKPHHAKMTSVPLQLRGEPGIVAHVRTDPNIKGAGAQHRQCTANLPCYYVDIGATAQPRYACKIGFLADSHVLVAYTQFYITSIFNNIQQFLPKTRPWTKWPTIWIAIGHETATAFTMARARCAQSRPSWGICANHASGRTIRPRLCLDLSHHGHDGCCYAGKTETCKWSDASRIWSIDSSSVRMRRTLFQIDEFCSKNP